MGVKDKALSGWIFLLISASTLIAANNDLQLVAAVKAGDKDAVWSLLKAHIDVNAPELDGATALAWAAHRDDLEMADLLIHAGANVNIANSYGVTPLSLACSNGSAAMVEKLLEAGGNPNAPLPTGETALMTAARTGNVEVVKLLLAYGVDVNAKETRRGQTALMWAVAENHTEIAQVLIEHGADVHARSKSGFTSLLFAGQQGNLDSARILLAAGADVNESTPEDGSVLVVASASGHEALSMFLLEKGADPNAVDTYGITALHYAILKGLTRVALVKSYDSDLTYLTRPNLVKLAMALLAHGANPNARITKGPLLLPGYRTLPIMSPVGATPFLLAAASGDAGLMRVLAGSGANPRLTEEDGTTPLIMAAGLAEGVCLLVRTEEDDRNALEAVKAAVELGADVNETNKFGLTALHGAAWVGSNRIIRFLVDKGAKLNVKDQFGQTPWSVAQRFYPPALQDDEIRPKYVYQSAADLLLRLGATALTAPMASGSGVVVSPEN